MNIFIQIKKPVLYLEHGFDKYYVVRSIYLTESTSSLKLSGSFIARSAKYFTVKVNILLLTQFVDELAVGHSFCPYCCVDTRDPQSAVFTLFKFTAYIAVSHTFFHYIFGNGIYVFTFP